MAIFSKKCDRCGRDNSPQAAFCAECGNRLAGGEFKCGVCGTANRSDAKFCKECGRPLDVNAAPEVRGNRWARQSDDFAVRIDASDLKGLFKRGIIVDVGTNAILLDGGANKGMLTPGTHNLDSLDKRLFDWLDTGIGSQVSALLVSVTPTDLEFAAGGVFTKDPLRIGVKVRLQAQVEEPARFLINMMGGRERLTRFDLVGYLYPEVTQVLEAWVGQHTVQELAEDLSLRPQLELALEETLKTTFRQSGLKFINVRATELNLEHLDRIKGIRSKYSLQISEAEAEQQGRESLFKVMRAGKLQEWAEEAAKVEDEERRIALYERMQKAVTDGKMNEIRSDAEFESFLNEMDIKKLLREKERAELLKTWKDEAEDKERARAHMLAKLELERGYELRAAELHLRTDLSEKEFEAELRMERMRVNKQFEIDAARQDYDLDRRRKQAEFDRQQAEEKLRLDKLEQDAQRAQSAAGHDEEMRQMDKELELGLKGLRGVKQVRMEEARSQWELEQQKLDFQWQQRQKEMEVEMQRERIRMEHELNRLDKLGQLGVEALIAASPVEQGRILADLKKNESLKSMSEEQILALAAKDSPEVARAIAEKYKAIAEGKSSEREREMYEKLLSEKEGRERATIEAWDKASQRSKETTERALDKMAEVAQAFARNPNPQVIVAGQGGMRPVAVHGSIQTGTDGAESKTCPKCGRFVPAESLFCEHCGNKFEGVR